MRVVPAAVQSSRMEGSGAGDGGGDSDLLEGFQIRRSFVPVSPQSLCFLELNVGKSVLQLLPTAGKSVLDLLPSLSCLVVGWICRHRWDGHAAWHRK